MFVHHNDKRIFRRYTYYVAVSFLFTATCLFAQETPANPAATATPNQQQPPQPGQLPVAEEPGVVAPGKTAAGEDKYVLGVLPNYRTAEMSAIGHPLTPGQKLLIATKDSFAPTLFGIGAAYALLYQAEDSHPEFGQGVEGYAKRLGTSFSDQVIGNFMTEGVFPAILRQDPRYFRMDHGPVSKRLWYAVSRIVVTRTDSGKATLNVSELAGNAAASGIGLLYYPDSRNGPDYLENWGTQLGTDAASQVLKEFWPDMKRWWSRKKHAVDSAPLSEVPPNQRH